MANTNPSPPAQGDGGGVGGVIMEDPLASAYRRKGGERKQT